MKLTSQLRIGTTAEKPLQASKWISLQALLAPDEMRALLEAIAPCSLYMTGSVCEAGEGILSETEFLDVYADYIEELKSGRLPVQSSYQKFFSTSLSATPDALYTVPVAENRQLIRICKPVVQMQAHALDYSPIDKKFRPMVFGSDSIPWGIQLSYPQLYLDQETHAAIQTKGLTEYPNTILFSSIQKWFRQHTLPTPFIAEEVLQNVPIRIGKGCIEWINIHPRLISKEIKVKI